MIFKLGGGDNDGEFIMVVKSQGCTGMQSNNE